MDRRTHHIFVHTFVHTFVHIYGRYKKHRFLHVFSFQNWQNSAIKTTRSIRSGGSRSDQGGGPKPRGLVFTHFLLTCMIPQNDAGKHEEKSLFQSKCEHIRPYLDIPLKSCRHCNCSVGRLRQQPKAATVGDPGLGKVRRQVLWGTEKQRIW